MTRPRTHTWMHLLPADAAFECHAGPDWLREPLASIRADSQRRVLVEYKQTPCEESASALVGINCPSVKSSALVKAGFPSVCQFAVLPSWENPRWFIPLENPAVTSAGFELYTPARTTARLKRMAARVLVHARLPFWFRDRLVIAQRQPSPLQRAIADLFPGREISLALSSGAPEGARNRKVSAAAIDSDGTILAFLKIAGTPLARSLLEREAENLRQLSSMGGMADLVPRLLFSGEIDGFYTTVQAPLAGGVAPTPIGPMHHALLAQLACGSVREVAATRLVADLPARIATLPQPHPELSAALEQALAGLENQRIATGIIHGDFAPWNLRRAGKTIRAFDWEYGHLDGPAGLDEIHYRLQVGYLLDDWTLETAIATLVRSDVSRYVSKPNQSSRQALLMLYLVDMLSRLYGEGYDGANDMVEWHAQLLERLCESAPKEAVLT